jgi:nitrogen fixation protein FixH
VRRTRTFNSTATVGKLQAGTGSWSRGRARSAVLGVRVTRRLGLPDRCLSVTALLRKGVVSASPVLLKAGAIFTLSELARGGEYVIYVRDELL